VRGILFAQDPGKTFGIFVLERHHFTFSLSLAPLELFKPFVQDGLFARFALP
jgi:hypothetical protein